MGSWMKDLQERVRRAGTELQPRVAQAQRKLEEGIEQMGLTKRGRDLYADDVPLADALRQLEALRAHLSALAEHVDAQRRHLIAAASAQRALSALLASGPAGAAADAVPGGIPDETPGAAEAARSELAKAQEKAAGLGARFALDMATPMADLSRTVEESYAASVAPLQKRYAAQKSEYLRVLRQAEAADADQDAARRDRLSAAAEQSRPLWGRTSRALQDEIRSLVAHAASSLAEWALNVAQAQAETYTRAAKAFEEPARLAQAAQDAAM